MDYRIEATTWAEAQLALMWIDIADRNALTVAANTLDRQLRKAPSQVGIATSRGKRIVCEPPLGVVFIVDEQRRLVKIEKYYLVG